MFQRTKTLTFLSFVLFVYSSAPTMANVPTTVTSTQLGTPTSLILAQARKTKSERKKRVKASSGKTKKKVRKGSKAAGTVKKKRIKKKRTQESTAKKVAQKTPPPPAESSTPWGWIVAILAALSALVGGAIAYLYRKNNPEAEWDSIRAVEDTGLRPIGQTDPYGQEFSRPKWKIGGKRKAAEPAAAIAQQHVPTTLAPNGGAMASAIDDGGAARQLETPHFPQAEVKAPQIAEVPPLAEPAEATPVQAEADLPGLPDLPSRGEEARLPVPPADQVAASVPDELPSLPADPPQNVRR